MIKIYKKNNYLVIDDGRTLPIQYLTKDIYIKEVVANISYNVYFNRGTPNRYQLLNRVSIPNILNSADVAYTNTEWVDFYTSVTGIAASSGSSSGEDSTAANQIQGNNSLSSIDIKLPFLVGGKLPVTDPTALPLPAGASTDTLQTLSNAK
jgi:hypothetical protein